jgi:hypothetical protein
MYITSNQSAISLFSGTLGAFLFANDRSNAVPNAETMIMVHEAIRWLQENNPLIRRYGFTAEQLDVLRPVFPYATISTLEVIRESDPVEPDVPRGHTDIVVDPLDHHPDVQNEDHRYHRLPAGIARTATDGRYESSRGRGRGTAIHRQNNSVPFTIPHGDPHLEALLFTTLYPNGKGQWRYTKPQVSLLFFSYFYLHGYRIEWQETQNKVSQISRAFILSSQMQRLSLQALYLILEITIIGPVGSTSRLRNNESIRTLVDSFELIKPTDK